MKALLAILLFFLLLLLFFISRKMEIPYTGELLKQNDLKQVNEKWKVVARVEILNGEIVKIIKMI